MSAFGGVKRTWPIAPRNVCCQRESGPCIERKIDCDFRFRRGRPDAHSAALSHRCEHSFWLWHFGIYVPDTTGVTCTRRAPRMAELAGLGRLFDLGGYSVVVVASGIAVNGNSGAGQASLFSRGWQLRCRFAAGRRLSFRNPRSLSHRDWHLAHPRGRAPARTTQKRARRTSHCSSRRCPSHGCLPHCRGCLESLTEASSTASRKHKPSTIRNTSKKSAQYETKPQRRVRSSLRVCHNSLKYFFSRLPRLATSFLVSQP